MSIRARLTRIESPVEHLHSRAKCFLAKFEQGAGTSYLDEAVNLDRLALELCPPGHPERLTSLIWLAGHLVDRYNQLGASKDIEEPILFGREALDLCPHGHHLRPLSLDNIATHLCTRYNRLGVLKDLDDAISFGREALDLYPKGHPDRSEFLSNLAIYIFTRHKQLGKMEDLDEAIALGREALVLHPRGHPNRSISLNNLSADLFTRYGQLGAIKDLDEALAFGQEALDLRPRGNPLRLTSLNNVASCLSTRYKQLGTKTDLDQAIVFAREALDLCPSGSPRRSMYLNNLGDYLSDRYRHLGTIADLNEAIILRRDALNLLPGGHPDRSVPSNNLAGHLSDRYNKLGVITDLDGGVVLNQEALGPSPRGNPDRAVFLSNLASDLSARYRRLGEATDLDEAIILGQESLDLRPQGHPLRSTSLNNLATEFYTQYTRLGRMTDLNNAIVLGREALDLRPQEHPDRCASLSNLAGYLSSRYRQFGVSNDLNDAIIFGRQVLDLCSQGDRDRSASLNNLAAYLSIRSGSVTDLDEAVMFGREALNLRPHGHPLRSTSLNNLAEQLSTRYSHLGTVTDLDEAIALNQEALHLRPQGHPGRSTSLSNLASCIFTRYNLLGAKEDFDHAITLTRDAIQLRPLGHPDRSHSLYHLAGCLRSRFTQSCRLEDKDELFALYAELAHVPHTASLSDLFAARAWVIAAEDFHHHTTRLAYETSLRFLSQHLATLSSLPQYLPILKVLSSSLAVDAFSACLRNQDPAKALELLEQGRGVFWNQIMRLRSPLDDVIASGPAGEKLANEFTRLTSLIRNAINSPGADQHDLVWRLNLDMQNIVTSIRELPGLSHFLLPSLFSDLKCAANDGPVIIVNASEYGCDALIVSIDRDPVHVPLRVTKSRVRDMTQELQSLTFRAKNMDVTSDLGRLLREVWDEIVSPIVDVLLRAHYPTQSRIWWCPTAEFSHLPLHAAGPYRKGHQNLSHLYISSYTPTLTALIRARRRDPPSPVTKPKRFLSIGQAAAASESKLVSVGSELDIVSRRLDGLATLTRIEGPESCISRVSEELSKNEWVHLACHGIPNRKRPFESAFALHDGRFTVEHIIRCEYDDSAEFAYLSACHTTVGDEESPDEVIHLASAMQFAGFRSVIGTMWAVDDGQTNKIASAFYEYMTKTLVDGGLDHTRAALALNQTMKRLVAEIPLDQRILYIHIGA